MIRTSEDYLALADRALNSNDPHGGPKELRVRVAQALAFMAAEAFEAADWFEAAKCNRKQVNELIPREHARQVKQAATK